MIVIYNNEHLARALWAADEDAYQRSERGLGRTYRTVEWDNAHTLDHEEYLDRAEQVVRLCRAQAKELVRA